MTTFPKLKLKVRDYLDELSEELTLGTKLPYNFARENLKLMALAALPRDAARPVLPWFPKIHRRQYLIVISDTPGVGKGETFRRLKATVDKSEQERLPWFVEFIAGESLGSPQWACVQFGGERGKKGEAVKRPVPGIDVVIDQPGRLVHFDEGKRLLQQDVTGKTERGLVTMFTQLFESNEHTMGSFAHGSAGVWQANVSLILHFTRSGFEAAFTGAGATSSGFLSRCTLVAEEAQSVKGDWRIVDSRRVKEHVEKLRECTGREELTQEDGVDAVRQKLYEEIAQADPLHAARLQFLFAQDLYARGLFSKDGVISKEAAEMAAHWTRHQMQLRAEVWPLDQSANVSERIYLVLSKALKQSSGLTFRDMKRACHTDRAGSGGITMLNMVLRSMRAAGEIAVVGRNNAGREIFGWVG